MAFDGIINSITNLAWYAAIAGTRQGVFNCE